MKSPVRRKVILFTVLGLVFLLAVGERVVSHWIRNKILQAVTAAHVQNTDVRVNLYRRSIDIQNLQWSPVDTSSSLPKDSLTSVFFKTLSLKGIRLLPLIRDRQLRIGKVVAADGDVRFLRQARSTATDSSTFKVNGVEIESLQFLNTSFSIKPDSLTTWTANGDIKIGLLALTDAKSPKLLSSYEAPHIEVNLNNIRMDEEKGYYSLSIGRFTFDRYQQELRIDSLCITPTYEKVEFARIKGTQSTWVKASFPLIAVHGLDLKVDPDSTLTASAVVISDAKIDAFRDRRVPLRRKTEMQLPIALLKKLSLALEIDSMLVSNMNITYEHFAEGGFAPGTLRFEDLEATVLNVRNREVDNQPEVITIKAKSRIMGKGLIQATFLFPLSPGARYKAAGTIQSMSLATLNPMLENAAFVSVEEGRLNGIDFQFSYNNDISEGSLTIDYQDLKINTLKRDQKGEEDQLKTLIVNTALKNNQAATGNINAERDKRRFIFHFWAASLMDGIKNAAMPALAQGKKKSK